MIGKFRRVFDSLRHERGEWSLFAVLYRGRRASNRWELAAAAPWLPFTTKLDDLGMILGKLREVTTLQDRLDVGRITILQTPAEVADGIDVLLNGHAIDHPVGLVRRRNFYFRDRFLRRAYVWAANLPEPAAAAAPAA